MIIGLYIAVAVLGYLLGVRLLFAVLKQIVRRTSTPFDDAFLDTIGSELKWLVMVLVIRYALLRLDFWSDGLRTLIDDVFFALGVVIAVAIAITPVRMKREARARQHCLDMTADRCSCGACFGESPRCRYNRRRGW